jgi:hypothetical protein
MPGIVCLRRSTTPGLIRSPGVVGLVVSVAAVRVRLFVCVVMCLFVTCLDRIGYPAYATVSVVFREHGGPTTRTDKRTTPGLSRSPSDVRLVDCVAAVRVRLFACPVMCLFCYLFG